MLRQAAAAAPAPPLGTGQSCSVTLIFFVCACEDFGYWFDVHHVHKHSTSAFNYPFDFSSLLITHKGVTNQADDWDW